MLNLKLKRLIKWLNTVLPVLLWYGLIFVLSDQPKLPGPTESLWAFLWFKSAHLIVYAVLTILVWRFWQICFGFSTPIKVILTTQLVFILAGLDEWHQSLVVGRTARWQDVGIDLLATALVLWWVTRYNLKYLPPRWKQKFGM